MRNAPATVCAFAALLLLGGCGATGDLADSIGDLTADYLILDLTDGSRTTANSIGDLGTVARYRDQDMVFRRVVVDGVGERWVGVFEVTQGQWQRLAGSSSAPWADVSASDVGSAATGTDLPAFNLSYTGVSTALSGWNAGKQVALGVTSDAEWGAAAGTGTWAWGDAADRATVEAAAVVFETQDGSVGPRAVGGRSANARGFYDLSGNVWEWIAPGTMIRGGSWHDPLTAARSSNQVGIVDGGIVDQTSHALIGVRLALRLP